MSEIQKIGLSPFLLAQVPGNSSPAKSLPTTASENSSPVNNAPTQVVELKPIESLKKSRALYADIVWKGAVLNEKLKDPALSEEEKNQLQLEKTEIERTINLELARLDRDIIRFGTAPELQPEMRSKRELYLRLMKALFYLQINQPSLYSSEFTLAKNLGKTTYSFEDDAYLNMGEALLSSGKGEMGRDYLLEALKSDKAAVWVYCDLARYYVFFEKNFEKADDYANKAREAGKNNIYVQIIIGATYLQMSEMTADPDAKQNVKERGFEALRSVVSTASAPAPVIKTAKALLVSYSDNLSDADTWLSEITLFNRNLNNLLDAELLALAKIYERKGEDPEKILNCYNKVQMIKKLSVLNAYFPYKWLYDNDPKAIQYEQAAFKTLLPNCTAIQRYELLKEKYGSPKLEPNSPPITSPDNP